MSFNEAVSKWETEKLSLLTDYISRGITPKYTDDNNRSILVVNQRCIREGKVLFDDARRHDIEKKKVSEEKFLRDFDVLVNSTGVGTLGRVSQIKKVHEPTTVDSHVTIVRGNGEYIDKKYLGYAIKAQQSIIENMAEGSTGQTELSRKRLGDEIVIGFPKNKQEQTAIAHILSTLDDKIEVNNEINKTLENMAQAIFKQWFVDFEFPNEDGMPYESSGGKMVESELGLIPLGWKVHLLKDFVPVITGKKNANVATNSGKYKFFTCSQIASKTDDYSFEGKAILVAGNGDFNVKFYNGKFEAYQRTYVLIPHKEDLSGFIYYMMDYNLEEIVTNARGSVISYLTKGDLEDSKIAFPEKENHIQYTVIFQIINEFILNLNKENEKLSELRDTLLPKLMSGEIRVPLDSEGDVS